MNEEKWGIPEGDDEASNAILFVLGEMAQNMETLYKQKMTFSGKHQPLLQHLEEVPMDKFHDQIPDQDPAKGICIYLHQ